MVDCSACDGSGERPELMPCPFCGEQVGLPTLGGAYPWSIQCLKSGCAQPRVAGRTRADTVRQWNTRRGIAPRL